MQNIWYAAYDISASTYRAYILQHIDIENNQTSWRISIRKWT